MESPKEQSEELKKDFDVVGPVKTRCTMVVRSDGTLLLFFLTFKIYQQMGEFPPGRRFDTPFRGPQIPLKQRYFIIQFLLKDKNRLHQFSSKVLDFYFGYALNAAQMRKNWATTLLQKSTSKDSKKMNWESKK